MKEKFIRILSPILITVIAVLDAAVVGYTIFAIKMLTERPRASVIFFFACDLVALVVAVLVTKEAFSSGVKFFDDELEFTGLDNGNVFAYEDIAGVETEKDTKASLVKNFTARHSKIILNLADGKSVTIDIGLTTKGTLENIANEIKSRIPADTAETPAPGDIDLPPIEPPAPSAASEMSETDENSENIE